MKILITGGAGFIGSALAHHLVELGSDEIVVVDCFTYAANPASLRQFETNPRFRIIRQDIREPHAIREIVSAQCPDAIIHLAAETHVDRSITGSANFIDTNVLGTWALLEAARVHVDSLCETQASRFRFLHVSTDEVFGSLRRDGVFSETTPYDPSSPYSASKAASDHLAMAWHRTYGLPVILTNCSNNYGPRQFPEKLIPLTILNALEGLPIPVYGDGENVRDWLHVDDHARALNLVLRMGRPGERYNVGAREERRNKDIVGLICDHLERLAPSLGKPRRALITFTADRLGHDRRYAIDPSKIENELGWRPQVDFDIGLAQTVDWYLANREWWAPLRIVQ